MTGNPLPPAARRVLLPTLCGLALLAGPAVASTDAYLAYAGPIVRLPSSPRPTLVPRTATYQMEEHVFEHLVFEGGGVRIFSEVFTGYALADPDPQYSIAFVRPDLGDDFWSIRLFRKSELFDEVTVPHLLGYIKGLVMRMPPRSEVTILEGPLDDEKLNANPMFHQRPMRVVYEVRNREQELHYRCVEYFCDADGYIVMVTHRNDPNRFPYSHPALEQVFSHLHFLTD